MANAKTDIDLADLHQAIEQNIRAAFPGLKTVAFYREETERTPLQPSELPACILELSELEPTPDVDPGTEQLAVNARFEARLVIGFRTPRAKLEIRRLAGSFAAWLRLRRWVLTTQPDEDAEPVTRNLPTGPADVVAIMPDEFDPELDRFEVWRVEWLQPLHLGIGVWTDEGVTPGAPLYSWAPRIGHGHEQDYQDALPPYPGVTT